MSSLGSTPLGALLDQIAAKTPSPGGGAVACSTGALAAALAQMVVSYSRGKKALSAHQPALDAADQYLTRARAVFLELGEEDAAAYSLVNELQKLPEGDGRKARELPGALEAATQAPMAAIAAAADLLRLGESLVPISNGMLHSDLAIAAVLADAAGQGSAWNVRVNAAMLADPEARAARLRQAAVLAGECAARRAAIERACGRP
jgi:formiminotetrahydrofolate cyclodeaminase